MEIQNTQEKMNKKQAPTRWMQPRHRVVRNIACGILSPFCRWFYGAEAVPFVEQGNRAYLILMNHQTPFDQFFVGMSFQGPVYYVATEDIFSKGWISSLLRWALAPIPIKKQTTDAAAVMTCIRVAREGGTIAMAPEGNRTYSGRTEYINPAIAGLAKKLKLPIALYRIEGGYGIQPRWSDCIRRGKLHAHVAEVIEPEEYASLSKEELYQRICRGLHVDEGKPSGLYGSHHRAEYLERAIYVCPYCGLSEFESHGNLLTCKKCQRQVEYGRDKVLRGQGFDFPFSYVGQWYDYQQDFVRQLDVMEYLQSPLYRDKANVYEVILQKRKNLLRKNASIALYGDRVVLEEGQNTELVLPFREISAAAVLGRNKLNLYHGDKVYQFKGDKRFNALKYVHIYFRHKYVSGGTQDGEFLGL